MSEITEEQMVAVIDRLTPDALHGYYRHIQAGGEMVTLLGQLVASEALGEPVLVGDRETSGIAALEFFCEGAPGQHDPGLREHVKANAVPVQSEHDREGDREGRTGKGGGTGG